MSLVSNQQYLIGEQYRTAANLSSRIDIHQRFSTNPQGWTSFVFEHLNLNSCEKVIELGCGTALLWQINLPRVPQNLSVSLFDLSQGMASTARNHLNGDARFQFGVADIQRIPAPSACFDLAVANHMLYHVPDLSAGLKELARVIKPTGRVFAATNGRGHLLELHLLISAITGHDSTSPITIAERFGLENGAELLKPVFSRVDRFLYLDSLWVTEAAPLVDYARSLWSVKSIMTPDHWRLFEQKVNERIKSDGGFAIRKETGLFTACLE
ncbi:MAG TPA: methyltransferase domain-containing protein [Anaerolineaceae bacterium]|nr:methyltransferase domain-containing protein [Anaerolineaceae bacterium]HPN50111.1 methyltransferase domain-containing protein [Anaerolineaceae bacterium]